MPKHTDTTINVRTIRHQLGLNQEKFAARLEVASRTIARWESGKVYPPLEAANRMRALVGEPPIHKPPSIEYSTSPTRLVIEINLTADSKLIDLLQQLIKPTAK